ncbi:MAG: hypothetical protein AAGD05_03315 [Bacteroidota bacterium]
MKRLFFPILMMLGWSVWTCAPSPKPTTEKLFAHYEIRYLQQERHLRALAAFQTGDSLATQTKSFPTVRLGRQMMEKRNLNRNGFRYQYDQYQAYEQSWNFRCIDEYNREYSYAIDLSPIDSFQIDGVIPKSGKFKLTWAGTPLQANENLILLFTDAQQRAASQQIKGPSEGASLMIESEGLDQLQAGKGQLYLVKKQWRENESAEMVTSSLAEFYTRSIDIEIE